MDEKEPFNPENVQIKKGKEEFILDSLEDCVYLVSEDYCLLYFNRALRKMFPRAKLGTPCYQALFQFSKPCAFCPQKKVFANMRPFQWESYFPMLGKWLYIHDFPLEFFTGKGQIFFIRDITDKKQEIDNLKKRDIDLNDYISGLITFNGRVETDGSLTMTNKTSIDAAGLNADEILGRHLSDTYWFSYDQTLQERIKRAILRAVSGETVTCEEEVRVKWGYIDVEFSLNPILDEQGKTDYIIVEGRDITALRKTQEELKERERFFSGTLNDLRTLIAILETDGTIVFTNNTSLKRLGIGEKEALAEKIYDYVGRQNLPELKEIVEKDIEKCAAGETIFHEIEVKLQEKPVWIDLSLHPIYDKNGSILYVVLEGREITQRKQAEEALQNAHDELESRVEERTAQLEAAYKDLESFSYSVSHDLRSPLRAIDGFSQLILENYSQVLDEKGHHYLERIRSGAQNMSELINDLLTLSHLGSKSINKEEGVNLQIIAQNAYHSLKHEWRDRRVNININECPPVFADPHLMHLVFVNIFSNALKFTRRRLPAEIEFGCDLGKKRRVFFVRDNGIGFEMKYADKLFIPFQRLHPRDEYEGTGIGLAIVKQIIDKHNGNVWAKAEPDSGTTLYFTLPKRRNYGGKRRKSTSG